MHADEKSAAFLELESAIPACGESAWLAGAILSRLGVVKVDLNYSKAKDISRFFTSPGGPQFQNQHGGKKKGRIMTPLLQLHRQHQYLFIALLLACFAISQSGRADNTPNKREIPINIKKPLQCAGGDVILHGNLVVTFKNVPDLEVVPASVKLEGFRGTAASGGRKLEVNPKDVDFLPFLNVDTQRGEGKFGVEFKVTGPGLPGGSPLRFRARLSPIVYKFRDRKVTKIIPDDTPVVRFINP